MKEEIFDDEEDKETIYNDEHREDLLDDDEISPEEEGFMNGYNEAE